MEAKIENMEFDSMLLALENGQVDAVIAGMTITDEKKDAVDFSDDTFCGYIFKRRKLCVCTKCNRAIILLAVAAASGAECHHQNGCQHQRYYFCKLLHDFQNRITLQSRL